MRNIGVRKPVLGKNAGIDTYEIRGIETDPVNRGDRCG